MGRNSAVGVKYSLRAGRPGSRIPVTARFSSPVQNGLGAEPASHTVPTGLIPEGKWSRRDVNHPPRLAPM